MNRPSPSKVPAFSMREKTDLEWNTAFDEENWIKLGASAVNF